MKCPPGSYDNKTTCEPCPVTTYQDSAGQTSCKKCGSSETSTATGAENCFFNYGTSDNDMFILSISYANIWKTAKIMTARFVWGLFKPALINSFGRAIPPRGCWGVLPPISGRHYCLISATKLWITIFITKIIQFAAVFFWLLHNFTPLRTHSWLQCRRLLKFDIHKVICACFGYELGSKNQYIVEEAKTFWIYIPPMKFCSAGPWFLAKWH